MRVELAVVGAVGEAWDGGLVLDGAVLAGPALLADARALGTEAVVRAGRMRAIGFLAESSFEASRARTLSAHAVTVSVAVGNFTFVVCQLAFSALPAWIAVAFAVGVITALIAQHRTDALLRNVLIKEDSEKNKM